MPDIPAFAVVDTSTELAKQKSHKGLVSFVNGVMRQYLRKKKTSAPPDNKTANTEQLALSYSVPKWLIERWQNNYGQSETLELLEFFQKPPTLTIRINKKRISIKSLTDLFKSKKISAKQTELVADCLVVQAKGSPKNLPGYKDGFFLIQDEVSSFVANVVDPKENDFVIDLCAAPGNKTVCLADLMNNHGHILAIDKNKKRLDYLKEKIIQMNFKNIEVKSIDALKFDTEKKADRILLDAPCTGTGVLHRRQDLRHNKQVDDITKLTALQRQLLAQASRLVKPGGVLVYSTCSIEPEENVDNIKWFLASHPEFHGDDIHPYISKHILQKWLDQLPETDRQNFSDKLKNGILQLLPFRHDLSGFFVCRMRKAKR